MLEADLLLNDHCQQSRIPRVVTGCLQWRSFMGLKLSVRQHHTVGSSAVQTRLNRLAHWQIQVRFVGWLPSCYRIHCHILPHTATNITLWQVTSLWARLTFGSKRQTLKWQHATTHVLKACSLDPFPRSCFLTHFFVCSRDGHQPWCVQNLGSFGRTAFNSSKFWKISALKDQGWD